MTPLVVETVEAAARRVGNDSVAVSTLNVGDLPGGRTLTYGELLAESARVAGGLAALGLSPGDTLGVWLPNTPEWLVLELAAARAGLRIAPINTKYRAAEVGGILRDVDVRGLVVTTDFLGLDLLEVLGSATSAGDKPHIVTVPFGRALDGTSSLPGSTPYAALAATDGTALEGATPTSIAVETEPDPDRIINLLFSSGTTSAPKVVGHSQRSLIARLTAAGRRFVIGPNDAVLCALPLCGVWGLGISLATLFAGGRVILAPVFDPHQVARAIADEGVTHFHGGDDMVRGILASPDLDPARSDTWRSVTFGNFSGKDSADLVGPVPGMEQLEISGVYGSSEALVFVSADPPGADPAQRMTAGGPLVDDMTQARVVDPVSGAVLGRGEAGELHLRGPLIATEYIGNPTATANAFLPDGWFRTGDLGVIDENHRVVFLARLRDSLRLRGFLVDPRELEEFIISQTGVVAAQVVGVADPQLGDVPVAFVQVEGDEQRIEARVIDACRAELARFKVPAAVEVVDEFPTVDAPNGRKIKRAELRHEAQRVLERRRATVSSVSS